VNVSSANIAKKKIAELSNIYILIHQLKNIQKIFMENELDFSSYTTKLSI
jgi:hypothetical protein